jgi:transcriptional regulator with XRE-family HTH domain
MTGPELREARKQRGVTATAVARAWEKDKSYISHIEARPSVTPSLATRYLAALDTAASVANPNPSGNVGLGVNLSSLIGSGLAKLSTYVRAGRGPSSQPKRRYRRRAIGSDDDDTTGRAA